MMRQMRQNTKIIMLVTALAFVALMVFEWGMDMSGQSSGGDLGRVGSVRVSVTDWQEARSRIFQQVQDSQNEPVSGVQNREIDDAAWDEVVNQILIRLELERRGIRVSDDEIRQAARFSPHPALRQDARFLDDEGQFNLARYHEFLSQASVDPMLMQELEDYYRMVIPQSKLLRQVTSGIHVSDALLWRDFRDQNERVQARFLVAEAPGWISDADATISDREIQDHYRQNRDSYRVPATARVAYTWVSTLATAADSAAALDRAQAVREEILGGASFSELARIESDDFQSGREGGRLGTFSRGQMVDAFEEAAFALPVGELSEPVQTSFGWHLIEVTARDEEAETVEARHILFGYEPAGEREIELLSLADSLESLGSRMSVADAARELGLDVLEAEITETSATLPQVGNAAEAQDWIFEEAEGAGDVSPVFENSRGFFMVEILAQEPSRTLALEEVRGEIEAVLRARRKVEVAKERMARLAEEIRGGAAMEDVAAREGLRVEEPGSFSRTTTIPGIGRANAAVGAAFGTPVGEVGGPAAAGNRVMVVQVTGKEEADRETFETLRPMLRAQLEGQLRQQRLELWLEGLRETTRIQDRRAEFFRAQERAADGPGIPMFF
jgi:peptidyl-prolyl cis-trans isomerase D